MTDTRTNAPVDAEFIEAALAEQIGEGAERLLARGYIDFEWTAETLNEYKAIKANGGLDRDEVRRLSVKLASELVMIASVTTVDAAIEVGEMLTETTHTIAHSIASRVLDGLADPEGQTLIGADFMGKIEADVTADPSLSFVAYCRSTNASEEEIAEGITIMRAMGLSDAAIFGDETPTPVEG